MHESPDKPKKKEICQGLQSAQWWRLQTLGDFPLPWDSLSTSYWLALWQWFGPWEQIRTELLTGTATGILLVADSLAFALLAKAQQICSSRL
jgi:hypothetical protein